MKKKKQKKTDAAGKYTRPAAGPGGSGPGISSGPYGGAQQHITSEEYVEALDDNSGVPKDKCRAILDRRRGAAPEQSEMRPNGSKRRGASAGPAVEQRNVPRQTPREYAGPHSSKAKMG